MRRAGWGLAFLISLILAPLPAWADGGEEIGLAGVSDGQVIKVAPDQEVTLRWGWATCNRGLVTAYVQATEISMEVEYQGAAYLSVPPPSRELFTAPEPVEGMDTSACVMARPRPWATNWKYSLGALNPGEYHVAWSHTQSHPVTDGADLDGDGRPDVVLNEYQRDFTIVVE